MRLRPGWASLLTHANVKGEYDGLTRNLDLIDGSTVAVRGDVGL
jgi:hypothetical protein